MDILKISPSKAWWELFRERGAVVYFRLPVSPSGRAILIRGSVVSLRRNRFGAIVAKVRVHARCRLYPEPVLSKDEFVEIDFRCVLGIDCHGALILP